MLKTQITGAKYLSPQTNQMTNLNIAIPADSKDTEFGTSDILLAKDIVAYLNTLDSDVSKELAAAVENNDAEHKQMSSSISSNTSKITKLNETVKQLVDHNLIKIVTELPTTDIDKNCIYLVPNKDGEGNNVFVEYIYVESKNTFEEVGRIQAKVDLSDYYTKEQTDSQIQIAKNSAINIHNEDNTKSIKLDIDDTEAEGKYYSSVNVSLTDDEIQATINAQDGFRQINPDGHYSNLYYYGLFVTNDLYEASISADYIQIYNSDNDNGIELNANKGLTEEEQDYGYSPIDLSLYDGDYNANINAKYGFTHKTDDGFVTKLNGYGLKIEDATGRNLSTSNTDIRLNDAKYQTQIHIHSHADNNYLSIGSDEKFKLSRPTNDEGGIISGIKSLTAFANPSATKVWATDGSTVDLTTKANTSDLNAKANKSDVLLKKSDNGGYYIEGYNLIEPGYKVFVANNSCAASGEFSFAEGNSTKARGTGSHAEGVETNAYAFGAHAEGNMTNANGDCSHAEGKGTAADGEGSHAQGVYNVKNKNAIHSIGIGIDLNNRKNSEFVYYNENDPKNGYKYLIGVGGYDGISTDNTTYKSVQEVIADLTARIEQLETKVKALEAANTPA